MPAFDFTPLLEVLLTSLSLFAMGWWPCGGCEGESCMHCSGGFAPAEIEVEISDLAAGDCYDCDELNGVYVLAYEGFGGAGCCWRFLFSETCEFDVLVTCLQNPIALGYQLIVSMHKDEGGFSAIVWQASLGDYEPDCVDWDNVDVQVTVQLQTQCADNASTCSVSAL
jgi:hypothetical protein